MGKKRKLRKKKEGKHRLQISKLEWLLMVPGMHKQLRKSIDNGTLDVGRGLEGVAWLTRKMGRASGPDYKPLFKSLTDTLESIATLVNKEDEMAKFELGITVGEITAMLPNVLAEAWEAYSDDKKITVDEALDIISVILNEMADAADDAAVSELFLSIRDTLAAIKPFVEEEEVPEEPPVE